jgi:hypothetical protein
VAAPDIEQKIVDRECRQWFFRLEHELGLVVVFSADTTRFVHRAHTCCPDEIRGECLVDRHPLLTITRNRGIHDRPSR